MPKIQSIVDFYKTLPENEGINDDLNCFGHFNVFPRRYCTRTALLLRRDFYKIALITKGSGTILFADKKLIIDRPTLFFSTPFVAHSWEASSIEQEGWFCLFTEEFMQGWDKAFSLKDFPMFLKGENPIVYLDDDALEEITYIFEKMAKEMSSDYLFKYSKLRNYLQLLVHEALKNYPDTDHKQIDASHLITIHFLELLENQFPIENPKMSLRLRAVKDFAKQLSIHENHLNAVVKEITGTTPSRHIASRIMEEAKALLRNSDWPVSDIAYSLLFDYPSHFASFFKKRMGVSPTAYRKLNL